MSLRRLFSRRSASKKDEETKGRGEEVGVNDRGEETSSASASSSSSTSVTFNDGQLICAGLSLGKVPEWLSIRYGKRAHTLDVSGNDLEDADLTQLKGFSALQSLVLDHNLITGSAVFPQMRSLKAISLNKNKIEDVSPFVQNLASSFPNLTYLSLIFNNACANELVGKSQAEYRVYRIKVLAALPNLKFLDSTPVSQQELVAALEERAQREPSPLPRLGEYSEANTTEVEYTEVARDATDTIPSLPEVDSGEKTIYSSIAHPAPAGNEYSVVQPEAQSHEEEHAEPEEEQVAVMPIYAKPNKSKRTLDFSPAVVPVQSEQQPAPGEEDHSTGDFRDHSTDFFSEDSLLAGSSTEGQPGNEKNIYITQYDVDGNSTTGGQSLKSHLYEEVEEARPREPSPIYADVSDQVRRRETQRLSLLLEDSALSQYEESLPKIDEEAEGSERQRQSQSLDSPRKDQSRRNSEEVPMSEWRRATADFGLRAFGCYFAESFRRLKTACFSPESIKAVVATWQSMSTSERDPFFKKAHEFGTEYRMAMSSLDFTWMKPISSYMHFGIILRAPLVRVFADVGAPALASMIHESWENMDYDDRQAFDDLAQRDFQSFVDFYGYIPDMTA